MPVYVYRCTACGHQFEYVQTPEEMYRFSNEENICAKCMGGHYRRDFKTENATHNFHPTVDLYANDLKRRAEKNKNLDRAPGWTPGG